MWLSAGIWLNLQQAKNNSEACDVSFTSFLLICFFSPEPVLTFLLT
jgi:hypothetical protein